MMCYEKSCRLCLKELNGPGIDCSNINELRETISKLFEVQINRNDNIKCICNKCFEHVMSFRAFKKTVTECQKIIKEYQSIRKKVLETRTINSIKQEIIDVDETSENGMPDRNKRKRVATGAVTDSDINDILALVHDKSPANSSALKVSSTSVPKKVKIASIAPITIKIEPETLTPQQNTDNRGRLSEPISSTSRDLLDKTVPSDDKLSSSSIGSSLDTLSKAKKQPVKKASTGQSTSSASPASVDTNAEAVSSSVQTPNESSNKTNNLQHAESSTSRNRQPAAAPPALLPAKNVSITNSFTKQSPSNQANEATLTCSKCPAKFKVKRSLDFHMAQKHRPVKATVEKQEPPKAKEIQKMKEEESISSSEEDQISIRGRSPRRAKSNAMKKLATSPTGSSVSPCLRRSRRIPKPINTPNNSLTEPRHTSTPILAAATSLAVNVTTVNNNSKRSLETEKSDTNPSNTSAPANISLNKTGEKKRIITITLVRTKESLNFRYCDQFKHSIEFSSVSPEELEDIRKSLMIPEIWTNLKNVFKVSPPDDQTINELRTIFGPQFNI